MEAKAIFNHPKTHEAAQIQGERLDLVGQCSDTVAEQVNDYLKEVTR